MIIGIIGYFTIPTVAGWIIQAGGGMGAYGRHINSVGMQGGSAIAEQNRPAEAREHVRRFHELFFTLSPEKSAIEHNVSRALLLADKSAYNYYRDFTEQGYYNRIISGNINQVLKVDSVVVNFTNYPYDVRTYAKQMIIRQSNVTERSLVSSCKLKNSGRSDDNPNGFIIENFTVIENKDILTIKK